MNQDGRSLGAAEAATVRLDHTRVLLEDAVRLLEAQASQSAEAAERTLKLRTDIGRLLEGGKSPDPTATDALLADVQQFLESGGAPESETTRLLLQGIRATAAAPTTVLHRDVQTRAAAPPLPVGYRLHEYRIDGVLGQGGFGITYLATDVNLSASVAIKEYLPADLATRESDLTVRSTSAADEEVYQHGLESFLSEARTLATFRHPNIVRVARFFEANRTAYMVLEYERGESLREWWKRNSGIPERELLSLLLPLLDGLAVVHEAGFLHRDIKPDNISVRQEDGSLVLLDFGSAGEARSGDDENATITPGYGPIEQYEGGEQGPWTDIYAFGATLYWMVTGHKPIEAPERQRHDSLMPVREIGTDRYSTNFLGAIDWALKVDPAKRPQNVAQFCSALFATHASSLGLQAALHAGEGETFDGMRTVVLSPRALAQQRRAARRAGLLRYLRSIVRVGSWPIAVKMMLAMIVTALAPMLITAYYNLDWNVSRMTSAELRNLEQLASSLAGRVSQLLRDHENLARYLGADPAFREFLSAPAEADRPAVTARPEGLVMASSIKTTITARLEGLVKANPDVRLAMVLDAGGTVVAASDVHAIGQNFKLREYFRTVLQGKPFKTGITLDAASGQSGMSYALPVLDRDKSVLGAIVLRIKDEPVERILESVRQSTGRVPFLVDGDGVLIHHPVAQARYHSLAPLPQAALAGIKAERRFGGDTVDDLHMPELARRMVGAREPGSVAFASTISGKHEIAGYAPVMGHDWVVAVSEPRDVFEAPLRNLAETVLYSVVLVGLAFMLFAALFARTIVRPIQRLQRAAHSLKDGNYDQANVEVTSSDEIGQLARTFNVMIDVLRQRERESGARGRRTGSTAPRARRPDT